MNKLEPVDCTLNIWYHLPDEIWEKVPLLYSKMPGWMGFHDGTLNPYAKGIPFWFSFNETDQDQKYISASCEIGGLLLSGRMVEKEFDSWVKLFKENATSILGFKVGEIDSGEVGYEIEWLK